MLENMTKEELLVEVKKMQEELYHLKMLKEMNISPTAPRPDGYAAPATRPTSEAPAGWALPADRNGQVPSTPLEGWPKNSGKPWLGAVFDMPKESLDLLKVNSCDTEYSPERVAAISSVQEKISAAAETIEAYKKAAQEEDEKEYSGWCIRITDFEGIKFLYLKAPDDRGMSLEVDTRPEVNGVQNRPQVLYQFASVLGSKNIAGVWPRWWKIQDFGEWFVLSRHGISYTITPISELQEDILRDFFKHLNEIRVPSIDEADGV